MMKTYQFKQTQIVNADIATVWSFFASPRNLNKITPPDMNFEIVDIGGTGEIQKGQIIKYNVSPLPFLRLSWTTRIEDVDPKRSFADDQIKGPFAKWYHRHTFKPTVNGVEMMDEVTYSIPFGPIGVLANYLVVQHRVREIFNYRRRQIEIIFPK